MADINHSLAARRLRAAAEDSVVDLIELFFFAYRDFISDPDAILAKSNFGRAHHRVLHFVDRNPGLTVADLLDILKITKQSLARVLKELVDSGFIEQRTGLEDRRQRLDRELERLHRVLAGALREDRQRVIDDALGGRLLAVQHHLVDDLLDEAGAKDWVRLDRPDLGGCAAGHRYFFFTPYCERAF